MSISIDNLIESIRKEAEKHYSDDPSHDWLHAERVCKMCMRICEKEGGDPKVLVAAALLHDVGMRYELEQGIEHSEKSVEIAGEILSRIGFPKDKISMVLEAISVHRFRKGVRAVSIESRILQDADRLDAMGAIGVARTFSHGGRRGIPMYSCRGTGSTIDHFYEKLLQLKNSLNTETARRIAEERHAFMEAFLSRFLKEIEGEA
ncbi:MAG: HD domain-containing protein [Candidatus Brockarchaeota archaeon]|nr:HD domain-containing protein [Candidatus Brockarchaeota archaeon]MBO3808964.1 HD domain-containing protein [Candidatus Brockarchaeota archaeon]